MIHSIKSQEEILSKLGIDQLNPMQVAMHESVSQNADTVLLSPTGSGKTLAFLLPVLKLLDAQSTEIQVLILTPSRELAIQIEQVLREMGSGFAIVGEKDIDFSYSKKRSSRICRLKQTFTTKFLKR